jgi:hypothetical protein
MSPMRDDRPLSVVYMYRLKRVWQLAEVAA